MTDRDQDKDELFEDLDKFFAPIQDVDWPEADEPLSATPATDTEPARSAQDSGDVFGEAEPEEVLSEPEADVGSGAAGSAFAATGDEPDEGSVIEGIRVRQVGRAASEDEDIDTSSLPHAESVERPIEPGSGSVGTGSSDADAWPFPAEAEVEIVDEDEVVEIVEPAHAPGAEDESVDVEAAAEHFASSVRAEDGDAGADAPPTDGYLTEELPTAPAETEQVEVYATETEVGHPYDADRPYAPETEVEAALLSDLDGETEGEPVAVGGEGPSWQEPTSVEVGTSDDPGRGGRDVPARFLTGVVLAAVALGSLAIGKGVFAIVASVLVLLAQGELYAAMQRRHLQPATIVGLATGALVLAAAWFHGEAAMLAMLALGTIGTFLWYMTVPPSHRKHTVVSIASTILPVVYIPILAGYALVTLSIDLVDGRALMIAVIALTVIYDTAAFAFGSIWGSRPLAQSISPKKSWEGAIAATLTLVVAAGILSSVVDPLDTLGRSMGLAIVVAIFAPLGDLAESLIKRDLDMKDMSSILPGHGGVLDRIDALLFVAPAAFLYFRIFL